MTISHLIKLKTINISKTYKKGREYVFSNFIEQFVALNISIIILLLHNDFN